MQLHWPRVHAFRDFPSTAFGVATALINISRRKCREVIIFHFENEVKHVTRT